MDNLFAIIGLGNPGSRYEKTRHNVGFDTIDLLSERHGIRVLKLKHKALIGEGSINGNRVLLVKPQTFMNSSGESVREIIDWYKISLDKILLIYDDIDLALGKIRIRAKGSSGTHNGMRSVIYHIQSEDIPRIRIGIGKPPQGWDLVDYVLGRFESQERPLVDYAISSAADAVEEVLESGIENAMNKFNAK